MGGGWGPAVLASAPTWDKPPCDLPPTDLMARRSPSNLGQTCQPQVHQSLGGSSRRGPLSQLLLGSQACVQPPSSPGGPCLYEGEWCGAFLPPAPLKGPSFAQPPTSCVPSNSQHSRLLWKHLPGPLVPTCVAWSAMVTAPCLAPEHVRLRGGSSTILLQ